MNVESEAFQVRPAGRLLIRSPCYLSAIAIFVSLVGIAWHPLRLILPSAAVALIASGMSNSRRQLTVTAVLICAVFLFLGFTVAVATSHPLW